MSEKALEILLQAGIVLLTPTLLWLGGKIKKITKSRWQNMSPILSFLGSAALLVVFQLIWMSLAVSLGAKKTADKMKIQMDQMKTDYENALKAPRKEYLLDNGTTIQSFPGGGALIGGSLLNNVAIDGVVID